MHHKPPWQSKTPLSSRSALRTTSKKIWSWSSTTALLRSIFETYEIDQQFHELIILASGNRTAIRVYKNLNSHSYATYLFGKQPRIQTINGILEHRAIYESMKAGNVDQVRHLLNSHLENAQKRSVSL